MSTNSKLNKVKLVDIFQKMDFGEEEEENTDLAQKWFESKFPTKDPAYLQNSDIENAMEFSKNVDIKTLPKAKFTNAWEKFNFTNEIINKLEENSELLVQLEMYLLQFTRLEATKSLKLFFNFLKHSSTCIKDIRPNTKFQMPFNANLCYLGHCLALAFCYSKTVYFQASGKFAIILKFIFELIKNPCQKYNVHIVLELLDELTTIPVNTPVLVFNDADLDSACDAILSAAFSRIIWSTNIVYVQEDVLEEVIAKLKHLLTNIRINFGSEALDIIAAEMVSEAKAKGIDVYIPESNTRQKFKPMLFTGGKLYTNNAFEPMTHILPHLNVTGFRNIKEAAALCNNQHRKFAASIWSQNASLTTEIVHSLNYDTIWVNTHSQFNENIPLPFSYVYKMLMDEELVEPSKNVRDLITKAINAKPNWAMKSREERIEALQSVAQKINLTQNNVEWVNALLEFPRKHTLDASKVRIYGDYEIKQFAMPLGVIYYCPLKNDDCKLHVISAITNGNCIIVQFQEENDDVQVVREIAAHLNGILGVVVTGDNYNLKELSVIDCKYLDSSLRNFCKLKTVWTSVGENFA